MPRTPRQRSISTDELRAECVTLERAVKSTHLADPAELDAWRPGGAQNTSKDARGWLVFFGRLQRMHARGADAAIERAVGENVDVLRALAEQPEHVELDQTDEAGHHIVVAIHPKSWRALQFIAARDDRIGWLIEHRAKFLETALAERSSLLERIDEELAYQHGLLIGAVVADGPGIPWAPTDLPDEVEPFTWALTPLDIERINLAFVRVNALRLHALRRQLSRITEGQPRQRPSWSTFFAATADEQKTTAMALMRDRSLAAVMAQAVESAEARRQAHEAADAEARARAAQRTPTP